jgi:hypothetical protein
VVLANGTPESPALLPADTVAPYSGLVLNFSGSESTELQEAPTAGANGGGIYNPWNNPGYITGSSGFATVTIGGGAGGENSQELIGSGFGFSPASGTPVGFGVSFALQSTSEVGSVIVHLYVGGVQVGTNHSAFFPASLTTIVLGGASDLWGTSGITLAEIAASGFGFGVMADTPESSVDVQINDFQMSVWLDDISIGSPIIASYSYYYPCRFSEDTQDYENFMTMLHLCSSVKFDQQRF